MPTIKQLHDRWRSDKFLGYNTGNDYGNDLSPTSSVPEEFTGAVIGEITYDPKNDSLKIIPLPGIKPSDK